MNDQNAKTDSDADLIHSMVDKQDECALEQLLRRHFPKIRAFLRSKFGCPLGDQGIERVMNQTAFKLWEKASTIHPPSLAGWLIQVARNEAIDLLREDKRHPRLFADHDPIDPLSNRETPVSNETRWRIAQLHEFADQLGGLQQKVMLADIAAGGSADSQMLAELHKTSKGSIEVTRSKVRKTFLRLIESMELQQSSMGGKT